MGEDHCKVPGQRRQILFWIRGHPFGMDFPPPMFKCLLLVLKMICRYSSAGEDEEPIDTINLIDPQKTKVWGSWREQEKIFK